MQTFYCHAGAPLLKPEDIEPLISGRAQMLTPFGQRIPQEADWLLGIREYRCGVARRG